MKGNTRHMADENPEVKIQKFPFPQKNIYLMHGILQWLSFSGSDFDC